MAIDKKTFDTLEAGARNQIISANNAGNKAEAERLYQSFLPPTPVAPIVNTPVTPTINQPIPNNPAPIQNYIEKMPGPDNGSPVNTQNANGTGIGVNLGPSFQETPKTESVEAPKPVTVKINKSTKTEAPIIDPNIRKQEIVTNLNEGYKNNEDIKSSVQNGDWDSFKSAYSMSDPEEAKVVEAYFQARQPKTEDSFYNILRNGQTIQNPNNKNNPEFNLAQQRYNNFKTYSGYNVNQLSSALTNGLIVGKLYDDLSQDPAIKAKLDQAKVFNSANGKGTDLVKVGENQTNEILSSNPKTAKSIFEGGITDDEYKQALETPEITAKRGEVEKAKMEYDELKATYDNVEIEVEKEYGTISKSAKAALIGERRKSIYRDLSVLESTLNTKVGTLSDMTKTQAAIFEANLDLYKTQQGQEFTNSQNDKKFKLQQDLFKMQQSYANPDINSTDPTIANIAAQNAVKETLKFTEANGIGIRRSEGQIIKDAQDYAKANGVTLGEALDKTFTSIVTGGEAYKTAMENISSSKGADKYEYKPIQSTDANGNLITTGYIAVNKSDPTDITYLNSNGEPTDNTGDTGTGEGSSLGGITPGTTKNRPDRNNNPGNLRVEGDLGKDSGGFGIFSAPELGFQAMVNDVSAKVNGKSKYSSKINTLQDLIAVYAPASDGNNPNSYSNIVAKALGVTSNTPITQLKGREIELAAAMAKHEGFTGSISLGTPGSNKFNLAGGVQTDIPASTTYTDSEYREYLNSAKLPSGIKSITTDNGKKFQEEYLNWKRQNNPLTEPQQKRVDALSDDYRRDQTVISLKRFAPIIRKYQTIDVSKMTATDKQGIISDYAKALDPDSVVREGEYATVAKYAQGLGEKALEEIKQALAGNGVLSNNASNKVIKAILERGKYYQEEEKSLREQYVGQINKVSGNYDGESQLVIPLNNAKQVTRYDDGTYKEYDGKGNYRYFNGKNLTSWTPTGKQNTSKPNANYSSVSGKTYTQEDLLNQLK